MEEENECVRGACSFFLTLHMGTPTPAFSLAAVVDAWSTLFGSDHYLVQSAGDTSVVLQLLTDVRYRPISPLLLARLDNARTCAVTDVMTVKQAKHSLYRIRQLYKAIVTMRSLCM